MHVYLKRLDVWLTNTGFYIDYFVHLTNYLLQATHTSLSWPVVCVWFLDSRHLLAGLASVQTVHPLTEVQQLVSV